MAEKKTTSIAQRKKKKIPVDDKKIHKITFKISGKDLKKIKKNLSFYNNNLSEFCRESVLNFNVDQFLKARPKGCTSEISMCSMPIFDSCCINIGISSMFCLTTVILA